MSTLKVDTINTTDGSGTVTISRPIIADITTDCLAVKAKYPKGN